VKEDVWAALCETFADPGSVFQQRGGKLYLDMWQANLKQARRAGAEQITLSELCTACNTEDFYSHRAENGQTGRFGVFIGLKPVWQN
jgi:copper oxidase (laccase) domain-containing protein